MKSRILVGACLWLLFISGLHVKLNVGWERMVGELQQIFGAEREELLVGFLPVT
jgi:hypothetical protein